MKTIRTLEIPQYTCDVCGDETGATIYLQHTFYNIEIHICRVDCDKIFKRIYERLGRPLELE